jgi:hypothetical protein
MLGGYLHLSFRKVGSQPLTTPCASQSKDKHYPLGLEIFRFPNNYNPFQSHTTFVVVLLRYDKGLGFIAENGRVRQRLAAHEQYGLNSVPLLGDYNRRMRFNAIYRHCRLISFIK